MNTTTTRWSWSGPEEGDGDDTVVIMFDCEEVMTVPRDAGEAFSLYEAKVRVATLCDALNKAAAVML